MSVQSPSQEVESKSDDVVPSVSRARRGGWRRNISFMLGSSLIFVSVVATLLAPWLAPVSPNEMAFGYELVPPSAGFPLGTDDLGRDILSRVLYGGRATLGVVVPAVLIAALIGVATGMAMGYFGGLLDLLLMRVYDIILAFPTLLLAVVLMAFLGPTFGNLVLSLALLNVSQFAVLSRSTTIALRESEYVKAAIALGANHRRILTVHLLRNLAPTIVTQIAISLSVSILVEAALTFLGIGVQPPTPTWGGMLNSAQSYLTIAPWLALAPGLAILVVVAGFNLIADGLRDMIAVRAA